MRSKSLTALLALVLLAALAALPAAGAELSLEEILDGVEARYSGRGFQADFLQESTIKAMQITDSARGRVMVKYPGKMRWEYLEPEPQIIITDGMRLWMYRPEDNQVMVGDAPAFFRDGRGASFLSDIRLVREKFDIRLAPGAGKIFYHLTLKPREKTVEIASVALSVDPESFTIVRVVTVNQYGDTTHIELLNHRFDADLDEALFSFEIPEGVDVLQMDAQ